MASIYKRTGSPYWWVKWREGGTTRRESTGIPYGTKPALSRARSMRDHMAMRESGAQPGHGWAWALTHLKSRHAESPGTWTTQHCQWRRWLEFFREHRITGPDLLTREMLLTYPGWRNSTRRVPLNPNTVRQDFKVLRAVLYEAVTRGYIQRNPAARLRLPFRTAKEKPELTDDHIQRIRAAIEQCKKSTPPHPHAQFYEASFEIAMAQGFRLAETCLHLQAFDTDRLEVRVLGKGRRPYIARLNPRLVPLIEKWRADGLTHTYTPAPPIILAGRWLNLFRRLRKEQPGRFEGVSFHSTRVTVISRLERANAPVHVVMKLVNHASTTVHRVYRRVGIAELDRHWGALP